MTRQSGPTLRQLCDTTHAKAAPLVVTAERHSSSEARLTRLTRRADPVSPPLIPPNGIARREVFAPTLPDHRSEVRFDSLAARVMGAS